MAAGWNSGKSVADLLLANWTDGYPLLHFVIILPQTMETFVELSLATQVLMRCRCIHKCFGFQMSGLKALEIAAAPSNPQLEEARHATAMATTTGLACHKMACDPFSSAARHIASVWTP